MVDKYGFVYIWFDRKHNRYYVGSHWGTEEDGYICSSTWMRNSFKRRPEDFKRRIIKRIYTDKQDVFNEEYRYLNMIKQEEIGKRYYNLNITLKHWLSKKEEDVLSVKEKISLKLMGNKNGLGKPCSDERKRKISETKTREKNPNYGKTASEETRLKMSEAHSGINNHMYGKKATDEHRRKKSEAAKKYWEKKRMEKQ